MNALLLVVALAAPAQTPPGNWTCGAGLYGDAVCDCGCGATDTDCSSTNFASCDRNGCTGGQVPWEHANASCMANTCGDGWKGGGEACDDGDALAGGGCNASCSAVSGGYVCGENAEGCYVAADAGTAADAGAVVDAGVAADAGAIVDAGEDDPPVGDAGAAPEPPIDAGGDPPVDDDAGTIDEDPPPDGGTEDDDEGGCAATSARGDGAPLAGLALVGGALLALRRRRR